MEQGEVFVQVQSLSPPPHRPSTDILWSSKRGGIF